MPLTHEQELELLLLEREKRKRQNQPIDETENKSLLKKTLDILSVPEKLSKEGLDMIAAAIPSLDPTGNLTIDILANSPKIFAETLAEVAPTFISKEAILTAGLLKGGRSAKSLIKGTGKSLAKAGESLSGLEFRAPGVLTEAAKDPTLIFGKGTKHAKKMFERLVSKGKIRKEFTETFDKKSLVEKAMEFAKDGSLTPEEALIGRRTLDQIRRTVPDFVFNRARQVFDTVAKVKSKKADKAFSRAIKSEALREPFPLNKTGGTSAFKLVGGGLSGSLPLMSPAIQGVLASALGFGAKGASALAKTPFKSGSALGAVLNALEGL